MGRMRVDYQQGRRRGQQRHWLEILDRVVGHSRIQVGADRVRGNRPQEQRIAVRRGMGRRFGTDHGAGAGAVVDDHLLAERVG